MNRKIIGVLFFLLLASIAWLPRALATDSSIHSQDGIGYSGYVTGTPIGDDIYMQGYYNWPEGFTPGNNAFFGGVFDGQCIWMIPEHGDRVIKVDKDSGTMT
ncbi:MAG: hypothetical protein ACM3MK_05375, partial [Chitinophagales bacterium]